MYVTIHQHIDATDIAEAMDGATVEFMRGFGKQLIEGLAFHCGDDEIAALVEGIHTAHNCPTLADIAKRMGTAPANVANGDGPQG